MAFDIEGIKMPATPSEVLALSAEEFTFALGLGSAAHSYRMPMESPAKQRVRIQLEDGDIQEFRFSDIPINRAAMAIRDHFAPDFMRFGSFMMRYFAFAKLRSRPEMEQYIKRDETTGDLLIHTSVYEVAASMPLTASWEFDPDAFFARVAELYVLDAD